MKPIDHQVKVSHESDDDTVTITEIERTVYERTIDFQDLMDRVDVHNSPEPDIVRSAKGRDWYDLDMEGEPFQVVPINLVYARDVIVFSDRKRCRIRFENDGNEFRSDPFLSYRRQGFSKQVAAQVAAQERRRMRRYIAEIWEGNIRSRWLRLSFLDFDESMSVGPCSDSDECIKDAAQEICLRVASELEKIGFIVEGKPKADEYSKRESLKRMWKGRMNLQNTFGRTDPEH